MRSSQQLNVKSRRQQSSLITAAWKTKVSLGNQLESHESKAYRYDKGRSKSFLGLIESSLDTLHIDSSYIAVLRSNYHLVGATVVSSGCRFHHLVLLVLTILQRDT